LENYAFIISIIGLVLTIIWNAYNTYLNHKNQNRLKIQAKIPTKTRLFQENLDYVKDWTNRMEFTETIKKKGFTIYNYKIRSKDGESFDTKKMQEILFKRYKEKNDELASVCGWKEHTTTGANEYRMADLTGKVMGDTYFSYPNDLLPKRPEDIKKNLVNEVITLAKENGVRLKK